MHDKGIDYFKITKQTLFKKYAEMLGTHTCKTIDGPTGWNDTWTCQFPFSYSGNVVTECIDGEKIDGELYSWCSTKVEGENRTHVELNWGICSTDCTCTTVAGPEGWKKGDTCQFPFEYSGEEYKGCVEQYSKENIKSQKRVTSSWCSTEVHFSNRSHIKGRWGKCSTGCPIQPSKHNLPCIESINETEQAYVLCTNNCSDKKNSGKESTSW